MKEAYYYHNGKVILNYSKKYVTSMHDVVSTDVFEGFLDKFLDHLRDTHSDLYRYLVIDSEDKESIIKEIITVVKSLLINNPDEINHEYMRSHRAFLEIIEAGYRFWRRTERYSVLYTTNEEGFQIQNFLDADNRMNDVVLSFYRVIQQKMQGTSNRVFRQLQAGTNASLLLSYYKWDIPEGYEDLKGIPFVNEILLRTPLLLHSEFNKRTNTFVDAEYNPMQDFVKGEEEWVCYPAKVGTLLIYVFFHRNFVTSAVATANLFELADKSEAVSRKPDAILLFGNDDGKADTNFYYDEANDLWVGKNSAEPEIEYFGYTKKSILTLHNLVMMKKGWLPIHGAMVKIALKDGTKKGLVFMGDSGAGKSETLEALNVLASDIIDYQETVFDDMGTLHINEEGEIIAQGTEVGAFVRLDDLDKGTAYRDMDRSIFFNPEKMNARVVLPAAPYNVVIQNHSIDCFLYANNYTDKRGLHFFEDKEEAKKVFIEGKRNALGTTQESGLSTTFFANPFGPMQRQEECLAIIDKIFDKLYEKNIPVGEVYTCLGLPNKGDNGINVAAEALVEFVKEDN